MATINILIAVDGAKLAQQVSDGSLNAGSQNAPTILGSYDSSDVYISMIAPNSYVSNGSEGSSELTIQTNSGNNIEWAITTFDNNFNQTPYLYSGTFNPADAMGNLNFNSAESQSYLATDLPNSTAPTKFINQINTVTGQIEKVDTQIQYYLSFVLVDNSTGNTIGYFAWDPFINVN